MHSFSQFRCISAAVGTFFAVYGPLLADAPAPAVPAVNAQQSAYQSSIAQETIRKQTDQVKAEINELVTELNVNGLNDPTNLALLSNASLHLGSLSQEDMQKVINTLQSASMSLQDQDRQKSLATASQGQKDILLKLKSLAADLAAQEAQKEIPTMLQNLIVRQSANIRRTSTIPSGQTVAQLDAKTKITHDAVSAEQSSIGDEIDLMFKILSAKPDAGKTDPSDTSKAVLDAMTNSLFQNTALLATQLTTAGPFPPAISKQKAVRTYLIGFLRVAMAAINPVAQLQQAKAQLDQVVSDQKDLADSAKQSKQDGSTLAQRQQKISDDLSVAQAALNSTSPAASAPLDQAQQAMAKSADALQKAGDPSTTAPQQQAVADALQQAESALNQQIASAEKQQDESPVDKLAQLQQLQAQINQAQQNNQTSAADLQKLQQDAMVPSPDAAQKIADAADNLQQQQDQSQNNQSQQSQPQNSQSPTDPSQQNQSQNSQSPTDPSQQSQSQNSQSPQNQSQNSQSPSDSSQQSPSQSGQSQQNQPQNSQSPSDSSQQSPSQSGQAQGNQPPLDHAEADKLLAQASADIQAQEDALKQSAQDYKALSDASQQLSQAEQDTQAADQAMQNSANKDLTGAAQDLSKAQASVDQMSQSPPPGGLPSDSQQALQQASAALKDASIQAVQAQGAAAAAQGQKAEDAMQKAQAGLTQAMAQVEAKAQQGQGQMQGQNPFGPQQNGQMTAQNGQFQQSVPFGSNTYGQMLQGSGPSATRGSALVVGGLKPKERKALAQYQQEKAPPEYADQVQQYLKNLADFSETH